MPTLLLKHRYRWVVPVVLAVFVALLPWLGLLDRSWLHQVVLVCLLAQIVSGLNLSFGYAGELSLGQPAIYAVGAYVAGYLSIHVTTDILVSLIVAMLAAAVAGAITSAAGLRLSAWSLAMVSFFLILLVTDVVELLPEQTGGLNGLTGIPSATLFGVELDFNGFFVMCVCLTALWLTFFRNAVTSRFGWALLVMKESRVLAESVGLNVYRTKVLAYVLGAVPAGLAGVLFAHLDGYVAPTSFGFTLAVGVLAASIVGGARSIYGPLFGAALLQIGPYASSGFNEYSLIVYGAMLLVGGLLLRNGIVDALQRAWRFVRTTGARRPARRIVAASRESDEVPLGDTREVPEWLKVDSPSIELRVENVSKAFAGVHALNNVSLAAAGGKVTGLIGPNGSGKTTLLNIISAFYAPDSGRVTAGRLPASRSPRPHAVARAGVMRTFQTPLIPRELSAGQVVATARCAIERPALVHAVLRSRKYVRRRDQDRQMASDALAFVGLERAFDRPAASLPLGTRRLVEVARALAGSPSVLLLDEPASGLTSSEVNHLAELLRHAAKVGIVVVVVEHNFPFVASIADSIVVLDLGEVIAVGSPEEIRQDPVVAERYLGQRFDQRAGETDEYALRGEGS